MPGPKDCSLTAVEVCAILKACGEAQVRELKLGNLHVTFRRPASGGVRAEAPPPPADTEISAANPITTDRRDTVERNILKKEEELSQLMIENPAEYERALLEGELEEGGPAEESDAEAED